MKKILYRKFLSDCLIFFIISLISTTVIIWVFQAVNYLDIVIDDGRDYSVYLSYAILSFPKIASKILHVCNSMKFEVLLNLQKKIPFNGYARGLLVKKDYILVGMSKVRRLDRFQKFNKHISQDAGVIFLNTVKKINILHRKKLIYLNNLKPVKE